MSRTSRASTRSSNSVSRNSAAICDPRSRHFAVTCGPKTQTLRAEMHALKSDLIKWMFGFWTVSLLTTLTRRMTRWLRVLALAVVAIDFIACNAQPRLGVDTGDSSVSVSISSCCPETDAQIRTLLAQYKATPAAARTPELAVLPHRSSNALVAPARLVIRDPNSWASIWAQIVAGSGPPVPTPSVDFERDMLIIAAMGARNTGGYVITIDSVTRRAGALTAWIREESPGRSCGTTLSLTQPIALARLPRIAAPVAFHETKRIKECASGD